MPASLSRDDVAHLADLARIDLTDAELDHLAPQLSVILESVASIQGVASADVPPTSHALPLTNVFREDIVEDCLSRPCAGQQCDEARIRFIGRVSFTSFQKECQLPFHADGARRKVDNLGAVRPAPGVSVPTKEPGSVPFKKPR